MLSAQAAYCGLGAETRGSSVLLGGAQKGLLVKTPRSNTWTLFLALAFWFPSALKKVTGHFGGEGWKRQGPAWEDGIIHGVYSVVAHVKQSFFHDLPHFTLLVTARVMQVLKAGKGMMALQLTAVAYY